MLAARVSLSSTFTVLGRDTILSDAPFMVSSTWGPNYQVTRDGRRILAIESDVDEFRLVISPNWITEFRRRVAESRVGQ